ncbi:3-KETOACYL-COA SYNTHASE 2 [Salix viminalis]|nr:3-KETOACYL-COA SYNTHASE 2 [Salix viminalis]
MSRPRKVYLVDFSCYEPGPAHITSRELFLQLSAASEFFTEQSLAFQKKILEKSGIGEMTYAPKSLMQVPPNQSMAESWRESEMVMFGAIDDLLAKTGMKPRDVGILVVNNSLCNPTPSLSARIVNHYKL